MMDSVTRFAMAQREIGLATGRTSCNEGLPLPAFFRSSQSYLKGAVLPIKEVLQVFTRSSSKEMTPTSRSPTPCEVSWMGILFCPETGSRKSLAGDRLAASISRSMNDVVTSEQTESAALLRRILAAWKESQDLVSIGAIRKELTPWSTRPCNCPTDKTIPHSESDGVFDTRTNSTLTHSAHTGGDPTSAEFSASTSTNCRTDTGTGFVTRRRLLSNETVSTRKST